MMTKSEISYSNTGTIELPLESVTADILPPRYTLLSTCECDCSGQAWGACILNSYSSSTMFLPDYTKNLCCLPCICFTFFGGARIVEYSLFAVLMFFTVAIPSIFLCPLWYCNLVMTGSNAELIRARIFWCRYFFCSFCCKRFGSDSKDDVNKESAIHTFILGFPSGIYCGDCCGIFSSRDLIGPQPFAHYLNLYMLLMCGEDPNLRMRSNQTPLHLVAIRLQRGRERLINTASTQPWWDWISFARYWYEQHAGRGMDSVYLHNHPIDVCGLANYYLKKLSICYAPCSHMPYDLTTTSNIHAAELLINYGADASLRDSKGRTALEYIQDADIRDRLQKAVDLAAEARATREREVPMEALPLIVIAKEEFEVEGFPINQK